jgi:hypothetical protein
MGSSKKQHRSKIEIHNNVSEKKVSSLLLCQYEHVVLVCYLQPASETKMKKI